MKHFLAGLHLACVLSFIFSAEPVDPGANSPDEAKSNSFSSKKASHGLIRTSGKVADGSQGRSVATASITSPMWVPLSP